MSIYTSVYHFISLLSTVKINFLFNITKNWEQYCWKVEHVHIAGNIARRDAPYTLTYNIFILTFTDSHEYPT